MKIHLSFFKLTAIACIIFLIVGILNYFFSFLIQDKITIDSKEYFQEVALDNKNLSKCNFYFLLPKNTNPDAKAEFVLNAPFKNCEREFFLLVSKSFLNQRNGKQVLKMLQKEKEFSVGNLFFVVEKGEIQTKVIVKVLE